MMTENLEYLYTVKRWSKDEKLGIELVADDVKNSLWIRRITKMSVVNEKNAKLKEIPELRTKALAVGDQIIGINGVTNTWYMCQEIVKEPTLYMRVVRCPKDSRLEEAPEVAVNEARANDEITAAGVSLNEFVEHSERKGFFVAIRDYAEFSREDGYLTVKMGDCIFLYTGLDTIQAGGKDNAYPWYGFGHVLHDRYMMGWIPLDVLTFLQ